MLAGVKTALAGLIIGTRTVVFVVSKAALVFSGPLSPFLSQGIGHVLVGSTVMVCVALWSASCRSVIVQPQDVTTVMVASAAGPLVAGAQLAGETAFASVVVLVGLSTMLAGLCAYLMGHFKLAYNVRYVPSPVTAGFLAANGLLLVREAFSIVFPDKAGQTLPGLAAQWPQWVPWLTLGAALSVVVRRYGNGLTVPLAYFAAGLVYYGALPALGLSRSAAKVAGHITDVSGSLSKRDAGAGQRSFVWARNRPFAVVATGRMQPSHARSGCRSNMAVPSAHAGPPNRIASKHTWPYVCDSCSRLRRSWTCARNHSHPAGPNRKVRVRGATRHGAAMPSERASRTIIEPTSRSNAR